MRKTTVTSALVFINLAISFSFGQLNLKLLKKELNQFSQMKSSNDWNAYAIKYFDKENLLIYEISYNKKNEIEGDFFGIAIYFNKYDSMGRCIENRYYDVNGKLHFTDWPPLVRTEYDSRGQKIRTNYYGEDEKFFARFEFDYDEQGREIEFRDFDKNLEIIKITRCEYQDSGKVVLESEFTKNNELKADADGIATVFTRYQTDKREKMIERKFFDKNRNLIEISDFTGKKYAITTYTYGIKPGYIKIDYFDINNQNVGTMWQDDGKKK